MTRRAAAPPRRARHAEALTDDEIAGHAWGYVGARMLADRLHDVWECDIYTDGPACALVAIPVLRREVRS